jgi:predicted nucleic acid-binding protein
LTTKKKIDKNKIIEGWGKIKKLLKIGTEVSANALTISGIIIGKRDPNDVPFVAMYFDLGAISTFAYFTKRSST